MNNGIFRKKSIDKVSSPEDLNSFLRVTNPPVWLIVGAVIIILIGAVVWGSLVKIETTVGGVIVNENQNIVCYVSEKNIESVKSGNIIHVDGIDLEAGEVSNYPVNASTLNEYTRSLGNFTAGEYVYAIKVTADGLKEGNYECKVVTERISPMSFLFNNKNEVSENE